MRCSHYLYSFPAYAWRSIPRGGIFITAASFDGICTPFRMGVIWMTRDLSRTQRPEIRKTTGLFHRLRNYYATALYHLSFFNCNCQMKIFDIYLWNLFQWNFVSAKLDYIFHYHYVAITPWSWLFTISFFKLQISNESGRNGSENYSNTFLSQLSSIIF